MTAETALRPEQVRTRRRRWPIGLAVGLVLLLAGAGVYLVWFTPVLGLQKLTVIGATGDVADEVRAAVGVGTGTPLIRVDEQTVEMRVEKVPQVADARITRQWPDTLLVTVELRTPVAVTSANGRLWLLDSEGLPYLQVPVAPSDLVTVDLATPGVQDEATRSALRVVDAMTAEFRKKVARLRAPSPYDISLQLRDGRTVIWGGSDSGAKKMQVLPALLQQPGQLFDISDPTLVTVR